MIDSSAATRELLLAFTPFSNLVGGERLWQGKLPASFTPSQGGVVYFCRGGDSELHVPLIHPSYEFLCWHEKPEKARELYRALHDALWDRPLTTLTSGVFLESQEEAHGQEGIDDKTGWTFVVSFWRLSFRKG